jgi:Na+/proline symporter
MGITLVALLGALWIGIGVWVSRRVSSTDDYLVGGRQVGVALGGATILATWVTGNTILAAPESGYTFGVLGVLGYAVGGGLAVLAFAPVAARLHQVLPAGRTVGDFFRLRYDRKNYGLFLVMLIAWDLGWLLTQGMAAGIILESVFGLDFHVGLVLTVLIVVSYVTIGGMVSVLSTDFMQTLLIMAVVFLFPAWIYLSANPSEVYDGIQSLAPEKLSLSNSSGLLFLCVIPLIYTGEVFMDNTFWQRAFALRPGIIKKTFTFAGVGWVFVPIATGTLAWVAVGTGMDLPGGPSSVAPEVVSEYAGTFGSVLFLGLIWAALASTMAALFNAVSGIFMNDVYQNFIRPEATDREVLRVGRLATLALAGITILIAWPKPLTLLTLLILLGVINTAYLAPIVLGLYYRTVNATGVFWSVIVATVVGLLVFGSGSFDLLWFKIHVFDMPSWLGGELQGAVVSFIIATTGTIGSMLVRPQSFDMAVMRDWTRAAPATKTTDPTVVPEGH